MSFSGMARTLSAGHFAVILDTALKFLDSADQSPIFGRLFCTFASHTWADVFMELSKLGDLNVQVP